MKKYSLFIILLATIIIGIGCSSEEKAAGGSESNNVDVNKDTVEIQVEAIQKEGSVVSMDSDNFILEIETDGMTNSYVLDVKLEGAISALGINEGSFIKFEYIHGENELVLTNIIEGVEQEQQELTNNAFSLLPKKPVIYEYLLPIPGTDDKTYIHDYMYFQDGYVQKRIYNKNDLSDQDKSEVYYEDHTGYYRVIDSSRKNETGNYIDEVKNNEKRIIIRYPVIEGDEYLADTTRRVIEQYPATLEGVFTLGEAKLIKVANYLNNGNEKSTEFYYAPNIGEVRSVDMRHQDQPHTLLSIIEK